MTPCAEAPPRPPKSRAESLRVAVDGIVLVRGRLVAVTRKNPPFRGRPALPGGFVELGESVERAVVREVREETGLRTAVKSLAGVYSDPKRDPRGHVVSVAFRLRVVGGKLRSGSDAASLVFLDPRHTPRMAFDHNRIVRDFLRRR